MIDLQCNVHTAICVLYQVGSPGPRLDPMIRQKNTDIEEHENRYRSTKSSISYTDIEWAFLDIDVFFDIGISRYRSFELRYPCFFDIVLSRYRSFLLRYHDRIFFDIVLDRYRIFLHSISIFSGFTSRAFDIELQNIRYRVSYRISISKVVFGGSISSQYRTNIQISYV